MVLAPVPAETSEPEKPSGPEKSSGPVETPHYHGHRERLRERFRGAGPDALSDYELLEMVLFTARAQGDVKPLAKMLIKTFGSFAEVVHAPEARLRGNQGRRRQDHHRTQADRRGRQPDRQRPTETAHPAVVMAGGDRLLPDQHGVRRQGAVSRAVSRQAQRPDRRRGAADRHRRPHPGLSARSYQAGAGIVGHRGAAGAQPSLRRPDRRRRPTSR